MMEYMDKKYVMQTLEPKPRFLTRIVNPDFTYSYGLCSDLKSALKADGHNTADMVISEYIAITDEPFAITAVPIEITYRLRG